MSMTAVDLSPPPAACDELADLRRELDAARRVQTRLMHRTRPPLSTLAYHGTTLPAGSVGGDYFDFIGGAAASMAVALGDVSGKGIAAALLMASLQAHLRSQYLTSEDALIPLVQSVNAQFWRSIGSSRFASLFFGRYDDASRRLDYVNCGHLPPVLLRADGTTHRLASTGTILGCFPRWEGGSSRVALEPGDALVLFSDGITEAENDEGSLYGEERLLTLLENARALSPVDLCALVLRSAGRFSNGNRCDDMTVVAARGI
jgi:serine phosphatase RsbU (regulator of sigma subunit)